MTIAQANSEHSESVHYRVMAEKLRELASEFRFAATRKELLDLASRYEQKAYNLDATVGRAGRDHS